MRISIKHIIFFTLLIPGFKVVAQQFLPSYEIKKIQRGQAFIRWEPYTLEEWEKSQDVGYKVEVYEHASNEKKLLKEEQILPATSTDLLDASNTVDTFLKDFYTGVHTMLHTDQDLYKYIQDTLLTFENERGTPESVDSLRLGFMLYAATYDFELSKMTGLAYNFDFDDNKEYEVIIKLEGHKDRILSITKNDLPKLNVPELESEFKDKSVSLKWDTEPYKDRYFGYYLEQSEDGKSFHSISSVPFVNQMDKYVKGGNNFIDKDIALEKNYKTYWFRLRGFDYFGIKSVRYSSIEGYGFEVIREMPIIIYANQTPNNEAHIKWKLKPTSLRLIKSVEIHRADERSGPYAPVLKDISIANREIKIPMDSTRNFYRVFVIPKDGKAVGSLPVFVMGMDTIPPAIPTGLKGRIDSTGIVQLSWDQNTESDLWGYRISMANDSTHEYTLLNASPISSSEFRDTLDLKNFARYAYYKICAVDKRNNRSPFSTVVIVEKPDVMPPAPPLLRKAELSEKGIVVYWDKSFSPDAKIHQLFRKSVHEETDWTLLYEVVAPDTTSIFYDTSFEYGKKYAYTVQATDETGLISPPSRPYILQPVDNRPKKSIAKVNVDLNKKKRQATIEWILSDPDEVSEIMIYKGKDKDKVSLYKIVDTDTTHIVEDIRQNNKPHFYYLNASYKDGSITHYSELIEVKLP